MEWHSKWNVTENGMSLKMEFHSKWNFTLNGISIKMECHSKWNVTQTECHLKWNITNNGMWLKMKCKSKWNVTQNGMPLKIECHLKWNVTQNRMSPELLVRDKKKLESILDSKKEALPYIVFVFLFIFELQFFSKLNKFQKNLFQHSQNPNFCFQVNLNFYFFYYLFFFENWKLKVELCHL